MGLACLLRCAFSAKKGFLLFEIELIWGNVDLVLKYGIFERPQTMQIKKGWLQIIEGEIEIDGRKLITSDGVELSETTEIISLGSVKLLAFEY